MRYKLLTPGGKTGQGQTVLSLTNIFLMEMSLNIILAHLHLSIFCEFGTNGIGSKQIKLYDIVSLRVFCANFDTVPQLVWMLYMNEISRDMSKKCRTYILYWNKQQTPGPYITTAIWRCHNPFNQWQRSFHWKLRSHWLKVLRRRDVTVVTLTGAPSPVNLCAANP